MDLLHIYTEIKHQIDVLDFESLWPAFHPFDFAVYNNDEVCLNGILQPKTPEFLANTAIHYQGKWVAIFFVAEPVDIEILTSKIIHEMFHAFQSENQESRFPDELEAIQQYEYSAENLSAKLHENKLLVQMLTEGVKPSLWEEFLQSKKHRLLKHQDSYVYEAKVEQIEGTANYIEMQSLKSINPDKYQKKNDAMMHSITQIDKLFPIRIGLYDSGALLLKLLDDHQMSVEKTFSDLPFPLELLDQTEFREGELEVSQAVQAAVDSYRKGLDELIDRITVKPPVRRGYFELLGVNVYDAKFHRGYLNTTNFVAFQDQGENQMLYGNYLLEVEDRTIRAIYEEK